MALQLVIVSDTHQWHKKEMIAQGDVLIHAGDFSGMGNRKELEAFQEWLLFHHLFFKKILLVPGNHDFTMCVESIREELTKAVPNLEILIDRSIVIDGVKFHGSPYVPTFGRWAFMKDDNELKAHWDNIPVDTQVLITHGPPHKKLDEVWSGMVGNVHAGSKTLTERIKSLSKLKLHVFGHIHEGAGVIKDGEVTYINAAQVNMYYENVYKPHLFKIE
jgi:Icc-related predicted phosphoesterase